MSIPESFQGRLRLPLISAPMFLVSGPELVIEACKAGIVGTFPALNERSSEGFEQWLIQIREALDQFEQETGQKAAPFGVNLIVHQTNPRVQADLELCIKHKVPLIITSLGAVKDLVDAVHSYGGLVFHDVINIRHAKKAAAAGVDGLIAVCNGAGGHAGTLNPFALLSEIRQFYQGTLILSGSMSTGQDVAAAQMMGADLAYMGTRFINTQESRANPEYKQMIIESSASDITYTPKVSGIWANFLKPSLEMAGLDPESGEKKKVDLGEELQAPEGGASAWKSIWSAGHGVGAISDAPSTAELVDRMANEYHLAADQFATQATQFKRSAS